MTKALAAFFIACALTMSAQAAHAATAPAITLSLFRTVRISDTALTLSFKTSQAAIGKVMYTEPNGSKVQLTDSSPQVDHLFTMTELAAMHGYTFTISATAGKVSSNTYVVLLSPDSIGAPGQSMLPSVQVLTPSGDLLTTTVAASSTAVEPKTFLPWWAFVILFIVVVGGWLANKFRRRARASASPAPPVPPAF